MKVDPMQRINGFQRVVLHPEKAQDAQQSLKTYRQIFGLPLVGRHDRLDERYIV